MWFAWVFAILVILSILIPIVLIYGFNAWYTSGFLLILFGTSILVVGIIWYRNNQNNKLSLTWPIISLVVGAITVIIGLILLAVGYFTRIPELIAYTETEKISRDLCDNLSLDPSDPKFEECIQNYPEYQTIRETYDKCRSYPNLIQDDIDNFKRCQGDCNRLAQEDPNFDISKCDNYCIESSRCLKFPRLGRTALQAEMLQPGFLRSRQLER